MCTFIVDSRLAASYKFVLQSLFRELATQTWKIMVLKFFDLCRKGKILLKVTIIFILATMCKLGAQMITKQYNTQ